MPAVVGLRFVSVGLMAAMSQSSAAERARVDPLAGAPVVVLAELFTSEGCSSCPPADDVLTRLLSSQPIPGVIVVGLGEHVDYWDRLGWRDPFSSSSLTNRQSLYGANVFRSGSIYTPQVVIDGRLEGIGSDFGAIRRAIVEAAKSPKAALGVVAQREGDAVSIGVRLESSTMTAHHEAADVTVAITEDRLATEVRRGENRGRTLRHTAVVRSLVTVGELRPEDRLFTKTVSSVLAREWKPEHLRVVAFVQEKQSRRILGVGSVALETDGDRR